MNKIISRILNVIGIVAIALGTLSVESENHTFLIVGVATGFLILGIAKIVKHIKVNVEWL